MNKVSTYIFLVICFLSCLSAPEFERDNINDLSSGIPYVKDSRYLINQEGLNLNWIDGSIQNNAFIITQKIYSETGLVKDSLIKNTEIGGDRISFLDKSKQYGFPHTVVITSVIYENGDDIKATLSDTLNLKFGELFYRSQVIKGDSLLINWQTIPNLFTNSGILVELDKGNGWEEIDFLPSFSQRYKYGLDLLNQEDKFRFSLTITNFEGNLSNVSSFELAPELN